MTDDEAQEWAQSIYAEDQEEAISKLVESGVDISEVLENMDSEEDA